MRRKILFDGGKTVVDTDPCGNGISAQQSSMAESEQMESERTAEPEAAAAAPEEAKQKKVKTSRTKTAKAQSRQPAVEKPVSSGIAQNITSDFQRRPFLFKWFRSVFTGMPYTAGDEITTFQVFPLNQTNAYNTMGNTCDQVMIHGRIQPGMLGKGNAVEVYGKRNVNNHVIATRICNQASGAKIEPAGALSAVWTRMLTAIVLVLLGAACVRYGIEGVLWAVILIFCLTHLPFIIKSLLLFLGIYMISSNRKR